ncbi:MAG: crossover junction endodeoxyribonuclease [Candidatus Pelagibacter sp. TMED196]|nr:MAG: crossover junction endodeoxyribonuclease [Candidatus Pelagibacter sp. TMED196]
MRIIGIDPGLSGGIAILDDLKIFDMYDMPIMSEGKKNKNQLNSAQLANIIKKNIISIEDTFLIVEQVSAMPGQGVTSMFNFGQTFGSIKGICAALNLPIFFVRPAKWKKHFDLINSSKDASRTKVIEMYPSISPRLSRKKDVNKADAILIARYFRDCRAQFNEQTK